MRGGGRQAAQWLFRQTIFPFVSGYQLEVCFNSLVSKLSQMRTRCLDKERGQYEKILKFKTHFRDGLLLKLHSRGENS